MSPFAAGSGTDSGAVAARLTATESAILADLAAQLIDLLAQRTPDASDSANFAELGIGGHSTPPLDPALARLLPDAYRDDDDAAAEHRHLTEQSLVERKIANARAVVSALESGAGLVSPEATELHDATELRLDADAVQAWLRTLTDLRLAIAARLEIGDDGVSTAGDEDTLMIYNWLGYLQGSLVEVIE